MLKCLFSIFFCSTLTVVPPWPISFTKEAWLQAEQPPSPSTGSSHAERWTAIGWFSTWPNYTSNYGHFTRVGKCPFLGILNITFNYLLEIISPIVGWCSIGTFTNPCTMDISNTCASLPCFICQLTLLNLLKINPLLSISEPYTNLFLNGCEVR